LISYNNILSYFWGFVKGGSFYVLKIDSSNTKDTPAIIHLNGFIVHVPSIHNIMNGIISIIPTLSLLIGLIIDPLIIGIRGVGKIY
jgi:hypothetical protein